LATQILDAGPRLGRIDATVFARDLAVHQLYVGGDGAANQQAALQRDTQPLLGSEERKQRRHESYLSGRRRDG